MRQVVNIQSTSSHISSYQQLYGMLTELLHRQVTLLLTQVAMQRLCIIAILNQLISHLLCLHLRTTEDDSKDARIEVYDTLQCQVLILSIHHIVDMVHVLSTLIA